MLDPPDDEAVMSADDVSGARERVIPMPQSRRPTIRRISQLMLAMLCFAVGVFFINEISSPDPVTNRRRVLLAVFVGLMFVLAFMHLVIYSLGVKLRKVGGVPESQRSWARSVNQESDLPGGDHANTQQP